MSTFKPLKTLTSRRQVLKAGLAALTLSGMSQAIAKEEALKTSNGHSKPKAKKSGAKRVVVLDPGHGGIDTGAIGRNGSKEKHVVLAIAKNVRSILRNQGIDARLTRSGDTFIPLYDRVEIAHKHGADLFMSIHADGFTNPSAAGASVFALSNRGASSAMAKYLSDRENRADEVAGKKATDKDHLLQQVLFDLVQTDTIKNSLTLGSHILKKIKPVHRLHSRSTEQAAFVVLKSPSIPSVRSSPTRKKNDYWGRLRFVRKSPPLSPMASSAISTGLITRKHTRRNVNHEARCTTRKTVPAQPAG